MLPQIQVPDIGASLARAEQVQGSRLQQLAAMRGMEDAQRLQGVLGEVGPALFGADPAAQQSALQRLLAEGGQGALPVAFNAVQLAEGRAARAADQQHRDRMFQLQQSQAARLAGGGPENFGAPVEAMTPDGRRVMVQMGNRGTVREVPNLAPAPGRENTPAAVQEWQHFQTLTPDQRREYLAMRRAQPWLNAGTQFVQPDPLTPGATAGTVPIDTQGRERDEVLGRSQGERIAAAPEAVRTADETVRLIDGTLNHPALRVATGALSFTSAIPGTPMFDFGQRVTQLQGRAFLEAYESLKGGGQITEREGQAATAAIARLSQAQTSDAFRESLGELRTIAQQARERAARRLPAEEPAAQPQAPRLEIESRPTAAPPPPRVGEVQDGWRFMGGDPSNAANWQRAR